VGLSAPENARQRQVTSTSIAWWLTIWHCVRGEGHWGPDFNEGPRSSWPASPSEPPLELKELPDVL